MQSSSGSSTETCRSRIPVQRTELERGIVRTCPRGYAAAFRRTARCTIWVCTVWVPARSREERSTLCFGEMITPEADMIQKSAATQAGILFLMTLIIAAVLEAVGRISNLLNQPINPMLLAAGAISAAIIWGRRT